MKPRPGTAPNPQTGHDTTCMCDWCTEMTSRLARETAIRTQDRNEALLAKVAKLTGATAP